MHSPELERLARYLRSMAAAVRYEPAQRTLSKAFLKAWEPTGSGLAHWLLNALLSDRCRLRMGGPNLKTWLATPRLLQTLTPAQAAPLIDAAAEAVSQADAPRPLGGTHDELDLATAAYVQKGDLQGARAGLIRAICGAVAWGEGNTKTTTYILACLAGVQRELGARTLPAGP